MAVKFFGQYLLERGLITADQLLQAIDLQRQSNPLLGELAVQEGMLTPAQAQYVNTVQRQEDKRFGDIAILLGVLSPEQIDTLAALQKQKRKLFGQILLEQNILKPDQLEQALSAHQRERDAALNELELGLADHPLAWTISVAIATCSRQFIRILRSHCQFSSLVRSPDELADLTVTGYVRVEARVPLQIGIACNSDTLYKIGKTFIGLPNAVYDDELVKDALGEVINVLMGYVVKDTLPEDADYQAFPPAFDTPIGTLLDNATHSFAVLMTCELGTFALFVMR